MRSAASATSVTSLRRRALSASFLYRTDSDRCLRTELFCYQCATKHQSDEFPGRYAPSRGAKHDISGNTAGVVDHALREIPNAGVDAILEGNPPQIDLRLTAQRHCIRKSNIKRRRQARSAHPRTVTGI